MKTYYSRIDWWVWAILICTALFMAVTLGITMPLWATVTAVVVTVGFLAFCTTSNRYTIAGNTLIVSDKALNYRYPIAKIASVQKVHGLLAQPAGSTRRIAIRFTDRNILKSSMPLEISPKDRDEFIAALLEVNPNIEVLPEKG